MVLRAAYLGHYLLYRTISIVINFDYATFVNLFDKNLTVIIVKMMSLVSTICRFAITEDAGLILDPVFL